MKSPAATVPEGRTTLYHRRHANQQRGKSLGHVGPAVVLLFGVGPIIMGDERLTFMSALEIAVGTLYLVLMVRELLHLRHNPFHREPVAWLELAAAGILALESYHIWHRHHEAELAGAPHKLHVLPYVYGAVAVAYVILAFRMQQMDARRFLHIHDDGFAVRTQRMGSSHTLRWAEVASVEAQGPADLLVRHVDGQTHRISFATVHDGAQFRDQLLARAQARLGVGSQHSPR
jgi:hypothetical protein